jgi:hypothetical protein
MAVTLVEYVTCNPKALISPAKTTDTFHEWHLSSTNLQGQESLIPVYTGADVQSDGPVKMDKQRRFSYRCTKS